MSAEATILIVDDEKVHLDVLIEVLQQQYRLLVAKSGEAALQRLQSEARPDLILLDVMMPGIDGYETCRRIKARAGLRDIPLIFLTSRDDVEGETYGLSLGAVDYIAKPISPPTVRARIRSHLALRQAQADLQQQNTDLERRVKERTRRLRQLSAELVLVEERERRRIAQELHDGPAQRLVLAKMNLGRMRNLMSTDGHARIDDVSASMDATLKELRTLMVQLSPPALYELGLGPAVEWLAESILGRHDIAYRVDTECAYNELDEQTRVFLFQAVRELLINIVKHAGAGRASVAINSGHGEIVIDIRDDGVGIDSQPAHTDNPERGGFGLFALRDRIEMLGGSLAFAPGAGTHATLRVPIDEAGVS